MHCTHISFSKLINKTIVFFIKYSVLLSIANVHNRLQSCFIKSEIFIDITDA